MESIKKEKIIIFIVSIAMFMELFDITALNTSLPQISTSINVPIHDISSIITIYLFMLGVLVPTSSYFVTKYGFKRILIFAFSFFLIGSLGSGFSNSLEEVCFFRFIQGVGGAFMLPIGRLIVVTLFKDSIVKVMAKVTSISLLAPILGPVIGGYITTYLSWHWIFFINIPICIIAIYLVIYSFSYTSITKKILAFDIKGYLLLFISFSFFFISSNELFITSKESKLLLIVCGAIIMFVYIRMSKNTDNKILNLNLFNNSIFSLIAIGNFLIRFSVGAFPFLIPIIFTSIYNMKASSVGSLILFFALGTWIIKPFLLKIIKSCNIKRLLIFNTIILSILQLSLMLFVFYFNVIYFCIYAVVLGIFTSIQISTMNSSIFINIEPKEKANGNAIYIFLNQLGNCFGVSLCSIFLSIFVYNLSYDLYGYLSVITLLVLFTIVSVFIFSFLPTNIKK